MCVLCVFYLIFFDSSFVVQPMLHSIPLSFSLFPRFPFYIRVILTLPQLWLKKNETQKSSVNEKEKHQTI